MAELKPLGSEKLQGDEKLKRILELTYFNDKNKKSNTNKAELVKESTNGGVYGIVKEKDGYYVKRGLNESSLDYIGGMFMKNKNRFSSYAEASKRLNLLQGQEDLNEATKYVLKQKPQDAAPATEPAPIAEPAPAPATEPTPAPADAETGAMDNPPTENQPSDLPTDGMGDMGGEGNPDESDDEQEGPKRSDYMAEVQKYAGKLGQELRDLHDKMESDDIKYVLNMVISAVDLDKLDDDDIEEIGKKFEREEDETGDMDNFDDDTESSDDASEEEMSESDDAMNKLESFINTPVQNDEIDLSSYVSGEHGEPKGVHDFGEYADLEMKEAHRNDYDRPKKWAPKFNDGNDSDTPDSWIENGKIEHPNHKKLKAHPRPAFQSHDDVDDEKELDLDEIKNNISKAVGETLSKYFN